jgi:trans-2,3-dihydro-3-hydroxyanthranilate isomerase
MSLEHAFYTADVFTDTPFGGNQLAVFPDARGIPADRLQDVAREFNFSETVFVLPPEDRAHTRRLRIFTPGGELPFAGHPTLGTAHVLAEIGDLALGGERTRIVFEEGVGPVAVEIRARDGKPVFTQLSAARLPEIGPPPPPAARLAAVVGLDGADVLEGAEGPQAVSCGVPFLFVPLRDRAALARARLDRAAWDETLADAWASKVFLFCRDPERAGSDLRARMFAPGSGTAEDPATGAAAVALAGYLAARDPRRDGTLRWIVEQGFEMGRPSLLELEADKRRGDVTATRVGGASVLVSRGTMRIPPRDA